MVWLIDGEKKFEDVFIRFDKFTNVTYIHTFRVARSLLPPISRSHHYLILNISETVGMRYRHSFNKNTYKDFTQQCHFE